MRKDKFPRLRDMRNDHDLTQKELAKILGMKQTGYSKYETGENDVPVDILLKLADLYDTSIDYLLGRTHVITPYPKVKKKKWWNIHQKMGKVAFLMSLFSIYENGNKKHEF